MEETKDSSAILKKLLTLKFICTGDELIKEIEKIRTTLLAKLGPEDIMKFIELQLKQGSTDFPVKIWLNEKPGKKEDLFNAFLAAAYFPKLFDKREDKDAVSSHKDRLEKLFKESGSTSVAKTQAKNESVAHSAWHTLAHIQKQLACATYYGHPGTVNYLEYMHSLVLKPEIDSEYEEDEEETSVKSQTTTTGKSLKNGATGTEDVSKNFEKVLEEIRKKNDSVKRKPIKLYFKVTDNIEKFDDQLTDLVKSGCEQKKKDAQMIMLIDIIKSGPK
jgi:hypothetical protein